MAETSPMTGPAKRHTSALAHEPIRRRALLGSAAVLTVALTSACSSSGDDPQLPEIDRLKLLQQLADIAIPATDTIGAGTMETVRWVDAALGHGMRGGSLDTLAALKQQLDSQVPGASFMAAAKPAQVTALTALDKQLPPAPKPDLPPWGIVKSLIFRAYYTSEVGASKELAYELVPGRFDPALPITPESRAWSTDQNARYLS